MSDLQEHINAEVAETLKTHTKHLEIANQEMGEIKVDVSWIKKILERHETMLWIIVSGIILTISLQILFKLYG